METPARLPRSDGAPALGRGGDDAARQRRCSRRAARRPRDRIPRAGHRAEDHAACWIARRRAPAGSRTGRSPTCARCAASATSPSPRRWRWSRAWPRRRRRPKRSGCRRARSGKFEDFAPHLEEVVHLVRDKAQLLGQARNLSPYDALVDEFSPGLTSARDRRHVQGAGAAPAGADPRSARAPGAAAAAAHRRQVHAPPGSARWPWKS